MPTLEKFVYNTLRLPLSTIGELDSSYICTLTAIATRPFLVTSRLNGQRRRGGQEFPLIISACNLDFVIDGHHKIRRVIEDGGESIYSRILTTEHSLLIAYLYKLSHGYVKDLEVV